MKPTVVARYRITDPSAFLHALERTEDRVHLTARTAGQKHTIRGVPGKHVDVIVSDNVQAPGDPRDVLVLEFAEKRGKFDDALRDRIVLRRLPGHQARDLLCVEVEIEFSEQLATLRLLGGVQKVYKWPRLRETLDGYNPSRIVMWHWRRYYTHLTLDDGVKEVADAFEPTPGSTLAEANRQASRALYALSRELGWKKLTLRERQKLRHPDANVWQRVETVERWRGLQTVGDYTLAAAGGPEGVI